MLLAFSVTAQAQTAKADLADFFGKKWVTTEMESHGQRFPANDVQQGDGTTFNADGTFSSVDRGIPSKGKWTYDPKTRILTAHTEGYDDPSSLRVVSISGDTATMESVHEGEDAEAHKAHEMVFHLRVTKD